MPSEVDVVVRNGKNYLVEIKASIDHWDVFTFDKIVEFYEKTENRKAEFRAMISPCIYDRAKDTADQLGITLYTDSSDFAERNS